MNPRHAPWAESADFAIGLRPISAADWLEGAELHPERRKDPLLAQVPDLVWGETEGSRPAQAEALSLISDALGVSPAADGHPPLYAAARLVPDDLCLMEKRDGAWRLTALSLSAPTFFSVPEVLGKSLSELHGPVPAFGERFLKRVERIFEGLRSDVVLERRNWTVVNAAEPHMPDPAPMRARIAAIAPHDAGRELFTRVERQTLRRLPTAGAALFTIRVWLDPLERLAQDPDRLAAFARAWTSAPEAFRAYKKLDLYDHLIAGFLRAAGETYSVNGDGFSS